MCPYCKSTDVRDARLADKPTSSRGGSGCGCLFLVLLLIAAGAAGYWYYTTQYRPPASQPAPPPPAPVAPPPPQQPEPEPQPEPQVEEELTEQTPVETVDEEESVAEQSRQWYELARNYRAAGRDDLARAELEKIIEAGEPQWVDRAQAMLVEIDAE